MHKTLGELAKIVGGEVIGDPKIKIAGARGIREAKEGDITFVAHSRYAALTDETRASAVIVALRAAGCPKPMIRVQDPSLAFARVVAALHPVEVRHPKGRHKTAVIAKSAKIGRNVGIGAYVVIEADACIGADTVLYPGCFIGRGARIGKNSLLWDHVSVRERVEIGDRVVIQSGTVIGSEGFGYAVVDGVYQLIPQVGTVLIEDDVEIGANVTIDRARFDKTIIGRGTKIDNLVQIAHNVVVGKNSIIVAQAGISGSTHLGNNVTIAGQAGLVGHISVGDGAVCAAQAGVTKDVPAHMVVSGYPAKPHQEAKKLIAYVSRLPELSQLVHDLKKRIEALEAQIKKEG
jgi:UDP-3-O-[3-hydroxymyristoyl] glucosamine N-acyltransferase